MVVLCFSTLTSLKVVWNNKGASGSDEEHCKMPRFFMIINCVQFYINVGVDDNNMRWCIVTNGINKN